MLLVVLHLHNKQDDGAQKENLDLQLINLISKLEHILTIAMFFKIFVLDK